MSEENPSLGRIDWTRAPGLSVARLVTAGRQELFVTSLGLPGEEEGAALQRAKVAAEERGGSIVSQDCFGPARAMGCFSKIFPRPRWPVTWIAHQPEGDFGFHGTQLWAVSGPKVRVLDREGQAIGCRWEADGAVYLRLGGIAAADRSKDFAQQARSCFELLDGWLLGEGINFRRVIRTWYYLKEILSCYECFNRERDRFFEAKGVFQGLVPASTGMGGADPRGGGLAAGLLAVRPGPGVEVREAPSPLQGPALDYGSSFSRAAEVAHEGVRRLFISGTAGLDRDGRVVHESDLEGQARRTIEVIGAILKARGMGFDDLVRAVIYLKEPEAWPQVEKLLGRLGLTNLPFLVSNNSVCRGELLFEMEADAVRVDG